MPVVRHSHCLSETEYECSSEYISLLYVLFYTYLRDMYAQVLAYPCAIVRHLQIPPALKSQSMALQNITSLFIDSDAGKTSVVYFWVVAPPHQITSDALNVCRCWSKFRQGGAVLYTLIIHFITPQTVMPQ